MGKILVLFLLLIIVCVLWTLPLYVCVNFVLWLFGISFHLTLLQAFGICLLIYVVKSLFGKGKGVR